MQVEQIRLPGTSGSLAAVVYGNPENPPILALHGWLDNADSFARLAPLLDGHSLVALDQAGHGLSDHRPAGTTYHLTDYVADLACVVRALGWRRFNLLGHSLGAGVCMLYAAAFPEQVARIIMIDGFGPTTEKPGKAVERLRRSVDAGLVDNVVAGGGKGTARPARVYQSWQQLITARRQASPLGEAAAELLVRRNAAEGRDGIRLRTDRRLRHPSPLYLAEDTALQFIGQIRARGLLVKADDGVLAKSQHLEARLGAFENLEVVELAGQHHLHMDGPDSVAAAINAFLASHPAAD